MSKVTIDGANMDGTSTFRGGTPAKKSQLIAECMEECKAFIQQEVHKSLSQLYQGGSVAPSDENTHPNIAAGRVVESGRVSVGGRLLEPESVPARQFERTLEMKIDKFLGQGPLQQ